MTKEPQHQLIYSYIFQVNKYSSWPFYAYFTNTYSSVGELYMLMLKLI